jgi:hypothetical protein
MEFFSHRCFFRATPLLPGHKLGLEQKKIQKMKVRKDDQTLTGNHHPPILGLFFSIPDICRGRAGFVSEGTRRGPRGKNSENLAKPEEAFS